MSEEISSPNRLTLLVVGLILTNLIVFGQVIRFDFLLWDDETMVVDHLQRFGGLNQESLTWALTNSDYGWRTPLAYLSLFADAEVYGLRPGGYHLTNLLIHIVSTLLLFFTLRSSTGADRTSAMAALLFAIHPLHVEPVAWVTGRWELLCGLFWMIGLAAYVHYCRSSSRWAYLAIVLAYVAGLASKPMALTFPFALLLFDYWPLRRVLASPDMAHGDLSAERDFKPTTIGGAVREKIPLFIITAVATLATFVSKAQGVAPEGALLELTLADKAANSVLTYAMYLGQALWPQGLAFFYLHPKMTGGFVAWQVAASFGLLAVITALVLLLGKRCRYLPVGWFWYLGVFTPAIGWLQVENHARADRYTYLPLIGVIIMVCWGVAAIASTARSRQAIVAVAAAAALVGLALTARVQTSRWKDSRTLFEYGVNVEPRNYKARIGLGTLAARDRDFRAAAEQYRKVLECLPGHSYTLYLLGRCHLAESEPQQAIALFQHALEIDPTLPRARGMLARAYVDVGDLDQARDVLEEGLQQARVAGDEQRARVFEESLRSLSEWGSSDD